MLKKNSHLAKCLPPQRLWQTQLAIGREEGRHGANGANNLAVSFSQRGNTSIDGSVGLSKDKASWLSNVQLTASHQTNGSTTIGANFNEGKGDRDGWNYGMNYDLNGGGPSASIGYTNPGSQLGLTSTIDRNGLSTSAEHLGTSIATMTQDGVKMDEINWMQQNINAAQDATETSQGNVETLKERGYSEEQIRNMTPDQHDELANAIRTENDNNTLVANGLDPDTMTPEQRNQALYNLQPDAASPIPALLGAFGSVGGFLAGALGLSIGNGTSSSPPPPANNANAEPLVGRRREDEEGGETATDRDGKIDGETSQSNILNGLTLSSISVAEQNTKEDEEGDGTEGDSDSDGSQSLETIRQSNLLANDLELVDRKPRVLTDNDGNPLYFAQATSDGIPRTDGSGNVRDRGPVDINIDRIKIESEKVTNKIGEPVINSEKISLLNSMPEIEFNDKIFKQGIINKENYFVTEKDGRLIGIQFQTDGKIKETQFEKKSKYLGFVTEYSPITQRIIDANNRYRPIEPSSEKYFNLKESILDNAFNSKKKLSDKEWENLFKKISEQRNADLSDFEKDYLNDTLKSLRSMSASDFNLIKAEYSNNKNTDLIGPRWRFDSLLPSINNLIMPTFNESIPAGGRLITFENGVEIIERDLDIDKEDLKNIVQNLKDHAQNIHGVKKDIIDTITKENAIGTNQLVKYLIPEIGSDGNGNILWKSYSFHKEDVESNIPKTDILHRYTDESTAIMFVSASQRWKELQIKTNSTNSQPIFVNDFSMPGAGKSVYNHHNTNSSIDIGIPGLNGSKASTINSTDAATREVYKDKNYDREKTIDLIKIMAESVPTGKRLEVFFNDPDVINYFKGTNISVTPLKDHHHHLHFQLSNEK